MNDRTYGTVMIFVIMTSLLSTIVLIVPEEVGAEQSGDFSYALIDGGTSVEITRYWGSDENVVVPDSIEGLPVTTIDVYTFNERDLIVSISLGKNMSAIDVGTFLPCSSLNEIIVDDENTHLTSVDGVLFDRYLSVLISCPPVRDGGFVVPNSVLRIETSAFESCRSLESVSFGEDLKTIESRAFYGCSSLKSVFVPYGVGSLEGETFSYCTSLKDVDLPSSIYSIPWGAFRGCGSLASIDIPESIQYIEDYAFSECDSLRSMPLAKGTQDIGYNAFSGCDNLTEISFAGTSISDHAFSDCPKLRTLNLSANLRTIGESAFSSCTSLTNVILPGGVTSLGVGAFQLCSSLTSVVLPTQLNYLAGSLFSQCTSLYNVTIPENVTGIGSYAFSNCDSLRSLTIPANVTEIGMFAFNKCERLDGLYFQGNAPVCDIGWVEGTDPQLTVYHYDTATGFDGTSWEGMRMATVATDPPGNGGNPFDTPLILAVLGLVAVMGVVAFVVIRKRRK